MSQRNNMNLASKTAKMFPHAHMEEISPNKVRLEFTEAESAEIELHGRQLVISCTCPALRDDFWMDSFNKMGVRMDGEKTWDVVMNVEDYWT